MNGAVADPEGYPDRLFLGDVLPEHADVLALVEANRNGVEKAIAAWSEQGRAQLREKLSPLAYDVYCRAVANLDRTAAQLDQFVAKEVKNPAGYHLDPMPGIQRLLRLGHQARYTPDPAGWVEYLCDLNPEYRKRIAAATRPSAFPEASRNYHSLIVAPAGWGKSELMKAMLRHYVRHRLGSVLMLDPGGDMVREVARWPELALGNRLIYIDPSLKPGLTVGLNPLDGAGIDSEEERKDIATHWALTLGEIASDLSFNMTSIAGHCARVLLSIPGADLRDFMRLLAVQEGRGKRGMPPDDERGRFLWERSRNYPDYDVATFFRTDFDAENYLSTRVALRRRIDFILQLPHAAAMLCAPNPLSLQDAFDSGKVVLVNLQPFRRVGAPAVGRLLIALTNKIGRTRGEAAKGAASRVPVQVFVDEVTTMVGPQMVEVLNELRKFGIHLTLAQQVEGAGFDTDQRKALKVNTGCKMLGGEPGVLADTAELIGLRRADMPVLQPHQFLVSWRGDPVFRRLKVRSDLADNARRVTPDEWDECVEEQVLRYYRRIEAPPPLPPVYASGSPPETAAEPELAGTPRPVSDEPPAAKPAQPKRATRRTLKIKP